LVDLTKHYFLRRAAILGDLAKFGAKKGNVVIIFSCVNGCNVAQIAKVSSAICGENILKITSLLPGGNIMV
jgi:hypothetical protein